MTCPNEDHATAGRCLAYAAQGMWARHITHIDGDRENVIGLPWYRLAPLLVR
jgi:predicted house-cleaning NTP pyrophosphatase (Maf/HAM1 superfamily)